MKGLTCFVTQMKERPTADVPKFFTHHKARGVGICCHLIMHWSAEPFRYEYGIKNIFFGCAVINYINFQYLLSIFSKTLIWEPVVGIKYKILAETLLYTTQLGSLSPKRNQFMKPNLFHKALISSLFLVMVSLVANGAVGVYTGSFDPPTKAHEAIIRAGAKEPGVDKLYVLVNVSGSKNFNTSSYERIEMLKTALSDLAGKIDFRPVLQEAKQDLISQISQGQKTITMIGEDSYLALPNGALDDLSRQWLVFRRIGASAPVNSVKENVQFREVPGIEGEVSSSLAREIIGTTEVAKYLNPDVVSLIRKKHLYSAEKDPNFAALQKDFYTESFEDFKKNLTSIFPEMNFSNLEMPAFKPTQSQQGWAESFRRAALQKTKYTGTKAIEFWNKTLGISFSFPRNDPRPKVSFVKEVPAKFEPTEILEIKSSVLKPLNKKDYRLDIDEYAADRFPKALLNFVLKNNAQIYLHNSIREEALEFHHRQGVDKFYALNTPRSHPDAINFLGYSSTTGTYRYIIAGLSGEDRKSQVKSQLAAAGFHVPLFEIQHKNTRSLFVLNAEGKKLKLSPNDLVVIGFKNRIAWNLPDKDSWTTSQITSSGLDMTLYFKGDNKILLVKNMYGDEMNTTLDFLKERGAKKIVYLGTAGGLNRSFQVGDVLLPSRIKSQDQEFAFTNSNELLGDFYSSAFRVKNDVSHGWVQTLLTETDSFLLNERDRGVESLDIETKYLAQFLVKNPSVKAAVALIVSDLPLGDVTYDQHEVNMKPIDKALEKIIPAFLQKNLSNVKSCPEPCSAAG